jgi:hypothetical protein
VIVVLHIHGINDVPYWESLEDAVREVLNSIDADEEYRGYREVDTVERGSLEVLEQVLPKEGWLHGREVHISGHGTVQTIWEHSTTTQDMHLQAVFVLKVDKHREMFWEEDPERRVWEEIVVGV